MRAVDNRAIAEAGGRRFRSDDDYAEFEYRRSAKVIAAVERAGVRLAGRVLDSGCGSGGTAVSVAEETELAVGLDLDTRLAAGRRLAADKAIDNVAFVLGDGFHLPFRESTFDVVLSHSVIEHLPSAEAYLGECHRVLRPGGVLYLSTAPHLSMAGAHLPRLRLPVPLHILLGRRLAFASFRWLAKHASWTLKEPLEANTFVSLAARGREKQDDLLQRVTVRRLAGWLATTPFQRIRQEHHVSGGFRRGLPAMLRQRLERLPWVQDVMIGHIQCVLRKPS